MADENSHSFIIGIGGDIVFRKGYGLKLDQFLQKITEKHIRAYLNRTFTAQTLVRIPRKNIERILAMPDIIASIHPSPENQIIFDGFSDLHFFPTNVLHLGLL